MSAAATTSDSSAAGPGADPVATPTGGRAGTEGGPLLELDRVSAGYGAFRALFDVSFTVGRGSVVALIGSNGAGKTTVARVCSGLVVPTEGRVVFDGTEVTGEPVWRFARQGITHAVEGRSVFASLTVEENLVLTFRQALGASGVPDALERAFATFPQLGERRRQEAGTLSGGEQRMLSLARVLANPPKLLIADELSLGLAPLVVEAVYRVLAEIRDVGTSLLIVEQQVGRALDLADEAVLLTKGEVEHRGRAAEVGARAGEALGGAVN